MPPRREKRWTEATVPQHVEDELERVFGLLFELQPDIKDGDQAPCPVPLDAEARAAWTAFYAPFAREQFKAEGDMAAALSKLEGYAARLALLHHVVTCAAEGWDSRGPISRASMEAGIELCRWFAREARRVYAALREPDEDRANRRLYEYIHARGGTITVRQLQKTFSRRYRTAEAAEVALDALVDAGLAEWLSPPTTKAGGTPTKAVRLLEQTADSADSDDGPDDGAQQTAEQTPSPGHDAQNGNSDATRGNVESGYV
jgi:hypothetical protein